MNGDGSGSLVGRAVGAALLNVDTFEAVEADRTATVQAAMVVGIVAIASAIGASGSGTGGMVSGIVGAFVSWLIWAGATNLVGTKLFGECRDLTGCVRPAGHAPPTHSFQVSWASPTATRCFHRTSGVRSRPGSVPPPESPTH